MKKVFFAMLFLLSVAATSDAKPNFLILFVDDWGWKDYGLENPKLITPNIDQLRGQSVYFSRAVSPSPVCSPSRVALMTGRHPAKMQIVRHIPSGEGAKGGPSHLWPRDPAKFPSKNWMKLEEVTYAEALKKLGYYNAFFGKWHLGGEAYYPDKQGFDFTRGVSDFGHPRSFFPHYFSGKGNYNDESGERYLTDKLTDELVEFLEQYDEKKPLMMTLWYYGVHTPHQGRKDLVEKYNKAGIQGKLAEYYAQISAVDESVGRIREALKKKGIAENTVIFLMSDQGSYFPTPPLRGKKSGGHTLCEGGARIPFFVYWKNVAKGSEEKTRIDLNDVFPTLLEMAGGKPSDHPQLDGVSLLPLIAGKGKFVRREPLIGYRAYEDQYASVFQEGWKFIGYRSGKKELYRLEEDESEEDNLAEEHPEVTENLLRKLIEWEKKVGVEKYSGY